MSIVIKRYNKADEKQLQSLISMSFEEASVVNIVRTSRVEFAYSAFVGDKLVGVIFGWKNKFHPNCTYFRIVSHPFNVDYAVEEKLLYKTKNIKHRPLITSIWETSARLKSLYMKNGFKEMRRTYMPTLYLTSDIAQEIKIKDKNKSSMLSLAEVSSNKELMSELLSLVKRNYENMHQENPIKSMDLTNWKSLILAEDTILNGSYVFIDERKNEILAYSLLHESDTMNVGELGWCGCIDNRYKHLIPQLIFQQIKYCLSQNINSLLGEFDTTDHYAMEVLKSFPFTPCPTWITYVSR